MSHDPTISQQADAMTMSDSEELPSRAQRVTQVSILWRVFTVNALVFGAAALVLVVSPATVHAPIRSTELRVLIAGLIVTLILDLVLLTLVLSPVRKLGRLMGEVDPLRPGRRASVGRWASSEAAALARAFNRMLDRLEVERRESARRAVAAQEDERVRVARELHDELGQALTAIALRAERASGQADSQSEALEEIAGVATASLGDVRRISRELRPEALDDLGLTGALVALCRRMDQQVGPTIAWDMSRGIPSLGDEKELTLYRVAQEALTNSVRHSNASKVTVALVYEQTIIRLTVADDGHGMAGKPGGGRGIIGMRERALLVGGTLDISSLHEGGCTVTLTVPLAGARG